MLTKLAKLPEKNLSLLEEVIDLWLDHVGCDVSTFGLIFILLSYFPVLFNWALPLILMFLGSPLLAIFVLMLSFSL